MPARSAPLPTSRIMRRMAEDEREAEDAGLRRLRQHPERGGAISMRLRVSRVEVAAPSDTDNAQCWSEEFFSLLSA